jgi:hypothetical protein
MKAVAFLVGAGIGPDRGVASAIEGLGLLGIEPYRGTEAAERWLESVPLFFFLFLPDVPPAVLAGTASAIRFSASKAVRLSPMVLFACALSVEFLRHCIDLGFDDVITGPFSPGQVHARLSRQLNRPFVFYETSSYFGPERRGRLSREGGESTDAGEGGQYRRLEVLRHPEIGVQVLRDDFYIGG